MNILTRKVFKILIIPPNFHLIFLRSPRQPVNPLITPEPQKDRQTLKDLVGLQAHDHRRRTYIRRFNGYRLYEIDSPI